MRSTLTMPISKGEAKSRFVEEYLNILLDYAEHSRPGGAGMIW